MNGFKTERHEHIQALLNKIPYTTHQPSSNQVLDDLFKITAAVVYT